MTKPVRRQVRVVDDISYSVFFGVLVRQEATSVRTSLLQYFRQLPNEELAEFGQFEGAIWRGPN